MIFSAKFQNWSFRALRWAPIFLGLLGCFGGDLEAPAQDAGVHLVDSGNQGTGGIDLAIVSPVGTGGNVDASEGLVGAGGADSPRDGGAAGDGDGDAPSCDCAALEPPQADRDGAELPHCTADGAALLQAAGYACGLQGCEPRVESIACECIPPDRFFGLPARCRP